MRFAGRVGEYARDMLLPAAPEERNIQKYRNAAWLRFIVVFPLLYGLTLFTMLRAWHTGELSPAYKEAAAVWIAIAAAGAALNAAMLFIRSERVCGAISLLCIAGELSSNEIVVYLTGVASSHALLFILIAVAAYRVYFDYRQGLFSAVYGVGIHAAAVALYLGGALPEPPVRIASAVGITPADLAWVSTLSLVIGVFIAFAAINLAMNKLHRMRRQIKENWKRDLDSIERFIEQVMQCADESGVYAETIQAVLYATPYQTAAVFERAEGGGSVKAFGGWDRARAQAALECAAGRLPGDNEVAVIEGGLSGCPVYCVSLECTEGDPAYLAVGGPEAGPPDEHRKSMLMNIAQGAGDAVNALRALRTEKERGYRDGLTGLYNKTYLLERLPAMIRKAGEAGEPLCVAMFDIDDFKSYNDSYGHLAGDGLLVQAARTLADALRAGDTAARFGGEEFIAVFEGCDREGGAAVAERFRLAVEGLAGAGRPVTVSGGVAAYPADAADGTALAECADGRLYKAKRAGKNRICTA